MSEEAIAAARPHYDATVADIHRRGIIERLDGRLTLSDHLDLAEGMLRSGDRDAARTLFLSAFIRQGMSRQHIDARQNLLQDLGVDCAGLFSRVPPPRFAGNTVGLALEELRRFAGTFGPVIAESLKRRRGREHGTPGLHPTAVRGRVATMPGEVPIASLIEDLFGWMASGVDDAAASARAAVAIDELRGLEGDKGELRVMAGATPHMLANAVALDVTRRFLRSASDLLQGPCGSMELFRTAASLDTAGLGPWFSNVGRIVRRSADVFELAGVAAKTASAAGSDIPDEIWTVLLARQLEGGVWEEFVDDLGDRNAALALDLILTRELARAETDVDRSRVTRIRDAALDNRDYELAGVAQRAMVRASQDDLLELRILGSIDASAGYVAAADQNLSICLAADPADEQLRREVLANRERCFAPFVLTKGFGSPRDRQLYRLHRRMREQALADAAGIAPLSVASST